MIIFAYIMRWICWQLEDIHDRMFGLAHIFYPSSNWETLIYHYERNKVIEKAKNTKKFVCIYCGKLGAVRVDEESVICVFCKKGADLYEYLKQEEK